jgi:arylsulfatase A-like enzyme
MKILTCVMLLGCASVVRAGGPEPTRPNILFIYSDDHAAHAISAYGSTINRTPNIDRLAAQGMLFENCLVTNSICAPARAVVLTGRFSHSNGVMTNAEVFDPDQPTFVPLMSDAGYQTAVIGKWHLKSTPTGFDHYEVLHGQGPYYNPVFKTADGDEKYTGYTTDIITDRVLHWLDEERDADRPFVLMYQHKAPHRNWMPDPAHADLYEGEDIPEPETLFDDYTDRAAGAGATEMTIAHHMTGMYDLKLPVAFDDFSFGWEPGYRNGLTPDQRAAWDAAYADRNAAFLERWNRGELTGDALTRFKYQRYIKDYLRVIASVDDNLGRVLDYLDETGLAENTIVIYTSDQGFFLGDHGWYDKRWMYEQSLRAPLIVRWPGVVEPGSRSSALVQNLDFAETFLDIAGVAIPEQMQGKSIAPLLRGQGDDDTFRDGAYYHYYEYPQPHRVPAHYGVRTKRYKLIRYPMFDSWELFDLEKDPQELHSLYEDAAYEDVRLRLTARLGELQAQYGETEPEASISDLQQRARREEAANTPTALAFVQGGDRALDPSMKALTVGGRVVVPEGGAVVVAHGGSSFGYALFFEDKAPCFAVRDNGALFVIRGGALEARSMVNIVGVINRQGNLELWVNGEIEAAGLGRFITRKPAEGLSIGEDTGSPVGDYDALSRTTVENLRVYWGTLPARDIKAWSKGKQP